MKPVSEALQIRRLFWTSFWLRFSVGMIALIGTYYFRLPLMEDAMGYSQSAAEVANSWLNGQQSEWLVNAMGGGSTAWVMIATLAAIYCVTFGFEALPFALACYCLLTAFTPVLAYRSARRLGVPMQGALSAARLVAFSPAFAFWSAALYKEGMILLFLFLIIDHTLRLQQEFRPGSVLALTLSLLALFGLRFYIAAIIAFAIVGALVFGRGNQRNADAGAVILRQALVLFFVAATFSFLGVKERLENISPGSMDKALERIEASRKDLSKADSGITYEADVSTVDGALAYFPFGLFYFLTVPWPWKFGSARQLMAIPETLFWIFVVYPRAIRGALRGATRNPQGVWFLTLASLAMCFLYAIFAGNIGTAYRMRIQVWAIWALLAGWGWQRTAPAGRQLVQQPAWKETALARIP